MMNEREPAMNMPPTGTEGSFVVEGVRILGDGPLVDLHVEQGRIVQIAPGDATQDALLVALPGFVDLHTHLREPGGEDAETVASGTRAAAAGGYTDVFPMANTSPVTDSVDLIEELRVRAREVSTRVHPIAAATLRLAGEELVDVVSLRKAGVTVFSDDGHCLTDDGLVYELLSLLAEHGGVFAQHAQSASIVRDGIINAEVAEEAGCRGWPGVGEEAIVARDIAIARATGGRLHVCHVSTRRTVDLIRWAKSLGAPVSAEVTPHHLSLSDQDAVRRGAALKVNPPLRSRDDIEALRSALLDGTIDVVATDHAPHPAEKKNLPWSSAAFGMTGIETALPIVADVFADDGLVDWHGVMRVMSTAPARIGGIADGQQPEIAIGSAATFCVVQGGRPWVLQSSDLFSKSRNTPFDGFEFTHRVLMTVLEGRVTHSSTGGGP
jgi:dihydroorotase